MTWVIVLLCVIIALMLLNDWNLSSWRQGLFIEVRRIREALERAEENRANRD